MWTANAYFEFGWWPFQVALNQIVLGSIVCLAAFSWNLVLTGKGQDIPSKVKSDFLSTVTTGT